MLDIEIDDGYFVFCYHISWTDVMRVFVLGPKCDLPVVLWTDHIEELDDRFVASDFSSIAFGSRLLK